MLCYEVVPHKRHKMIKSPALAFVAESMRNMNGSVAGDRRCSMLYLLTHSVGRNRRKRMHFLV